MNNTQEQPPGFTQTATNGFNLLLFFVQVHCLLPILLCRRIGTRGLRATPVPILFAAFLYIPGFWCFAYQNTRVYIHNSQVMSVCWLSLLVLVIAHRFGTIIATRRGRVIHSHSMGISNGVYRGLSVNASLYLLEPLLCITLGLALYQVDVPIGVYFITAGMVIWVPVAYVDFRDSRMAQDMIDSRLQQEQIALIVREKMDR